MSAPGTVYGLHAVRALIERGAARIETLYVQRGHREGRLDALLELARSARVHVEERAMNELNAICSGARHQGVVARVSAGSSLGEGALDDLLDRCTEAPLLLVLDGVQDPHNLGACLRTADAAGAAGVIVPRDRAAGLSATVRKVASGAAESVPLVQVVNLARTLRWLRERGLWVVGTDADAAKSLYEADLRGPLAIVMGAEGTGLRRLTRESCDVLVQIPMQGSVATLNVSVAAGVLLFEAIRQRRA